MRNEAGMTQSIVGKQVARNSSSSIEKISEFSAPLPLASVVSDPAGRDRDGGRWLTLLS